MPLRTFLVFSLEKNSPGPKQSNACKHFSGIIRFWDHDDILRQNPNFMLFLPHEKIRLVAREDSSGTTAIFTRALSSFVANFAPGVGKLVVWPASTLKGQQNSGLLEAVSSTPYSIGYAVVGDVKRHKGLQCVNIHNGDNLPIAPTIDAVHTAISLARKLRHPMIFFLMLSLQIHRQKHGRYQSYTYFAIRKFSRPASRKTCSERKAVVDFLMWFYTSRLAMEAAEEHDFIVLPYHQRREILERLIKISCGKSDFKPIYDRVVDYSNMTKAELLTKQSKFCSSAEWTVKHSCGPFAVMGPIVPAVNAPSLPPVPFTVYTNLALNCLLLSSLVLIEHLANAKMCAQKSKMPLDENHELFVLGLSNIFGGLFSGFVTGGGFSRTAINISTGAVSQISLLLSALFAIIITFGIAPAIAYLPKFVVAVVIIVAVSSLIDVKEIRALWTMSKSDFLLLIIGIIFTLTLGITNGLLASVALSIGMFLKIASVPVISTLGRASNSTDYRPLKRDMSHSKIPKPDGILILRFEAHYFSPTFQS